jgi:hypothetical protein
MIDPCNIVHITWCILPCAVCTGNLTLYLYWPFSHPGLLTCRIPMEKINWILNTQGQNRLQIRGSPCWTGPTPENLLWKHSTRQIYCTLCSPQYQVGSPRENPTLVAFLPFIYTNFNCISGLPSETVDISPGILRLHSSCQERPWPKTFAIYSIICKHGEM